MISNVIGIDPLGACMHVLNVMEIHLITVETVH